MNTRPVVTRKCTASAQAYLSLGTFQCLSRGVCPISSNTYEGSMVVCVSFSPHQIHQKNTYQRHKSRKHLLYLVKLITMDESFVVSNDNYRLLLNHLQIGMQLITGQLQRSQTEHTQSSHSECSNND